MGGGIDEQRKWRPRELEVRLSYDPSEKLKYQDGDVTCCYWPVRWNPEPIGETQRNLRDATLPGEKYWSRAYGGRTSHGEFPVVVVREHYLNQGYTVWASEPRLTDPQVPHAKAKLGYVLLSYPGARNPKHRHYDNCRRMIRLFENHEVLEKLNEEADRCKRRLKKGRGGGDPDLFVFRGDGKKERFFVEVKEEDDLLPVQELCFGLIEEYLRCDVKICRVHPQKKK